MAVWAVSLVVLLVAAGANGQTVAGLGQLCRSGGNILPITCASGLSCVANSTNPPTLPDVATLGTCQAPVSNATLAVYQTVKAQNDLLVQALSGGNFLAVANFVTNDVQLVLPNITSPLTLTNITTLLAFSNKLSPLPGTTFPSPVTRLFRLIDANNSLTVQELAAGQLGNVFITALWQLYPDGWTVAFADITPADNGTIVNTTTPVIQTTPNATAGVNATANVTTGNSTTIQRAVVNASNALVAAIVAAALNGTSANATSANATSANTTAPSLANATAPYLANGSEFVFATLPGPTPLNFSDPNIVLLAQQLRNTVVNGTNQTFVAYRQLNSVAALCTSKLYGTAMNVAYGTYLTQLWQYLPSLNGNGSSWQLTYGAFNVAPPGPAPNAITLL